MLRISHYWNRDFDEWNEMIALKKSRDLVICSWRQHLQKQELWATNLPQLCSEFLPLYGSGTWKTPTHWSQPRSQALALWHSR